MPEYQEIINTIDQQLTDVRKSVIISGNFNAKSAEWRGVITESRGSMVSELLLKYDLQVCNDGNPPTFCNENRSSYIDVTACSTNLLPRLIG